MTPSNFIHPLSSLETIDTVAQELFGSSEENQSHLDKLMIRSKKGDETATREAIVFIAFALDEKLEEAFEE